jgi:hypothetical protein
MEVVGVVVGVAVVALIIWAQVGALFTRRYPRRQDEDG